MTARFPLHKYLNISFVVMLCAAMLVSCGAPAPTTAPADTMAPAATAAPADTMAPAPTATTAPAAPAATATPALKTFVFGRYTDAINPDPVMNDANADIWYMQQYYNGLTRFKVDNSVEPDLATSWDTSADGLTWTFHLRPNAKWSDGSPITGADWQWSLDRCRDTKNGIWAFTMDPVTKVEATDTQVVFHLKVAAPYFLSSTAMFNCVVMPGSKVEAAGGWEKFMLAPIGSGPFIMKEWIKGDHMLLVRNPNYWEQGKPVLDQILIKTIPDDNARILALQSGDVDAINYPPFNRIPDLSKDPNLKVIQFPSTYENFLTLNVRNKPLSDVNVRQALSYALDRQALIKTINFGIGIPATGYRIPGSLYHDDTLTGWNYDIAKAKDLLTKAGYPNGFTTTLEIVGTNQTSTQIATLVQAMWSQIGVTLNITKSEAGLVTSNYRAGKFDIQIHGWTDDIPDPSEFSSYAMASQPIQFMHSGWVCDQCDKLVAQGLVETDSAKRQAIYTQLQQLYVQNVPFLVLWVEPYLVMTRSNVTNFEQTPLGIYIWTNLSKQ